MITGVFSLVFLCPKSLVFGFLVSVLQRLRRVPPRPPSSPPEFSSLYSIPRVNESIQVPSTRLSNRAPPVACHKPPTSLLSHFRALRASFAMPVVTSNMGSKESSMSSPQDPRSALAADVLRTAGAPSALLVRQSPRVRARSHSALLWHRTGPMAHGSAPGTWTGPRKPKQKEKERREEGEEVE